MSSRDNILGRIRSALADAPEVELPPVPEVWPRTNPATEAMVKQFTEEMDALRGEVIRCTDPADARAKLAKLLAELDAKRIGVTERDACRDAVADLSDIEIEWGQSDPHAKSMADLTASLITADYLLADTGSCVVECNTAFERLMCYLPPISIIVATTEQLVEHMPAAWEDVMPRAAEADRRGEFVVITGPSRTADIEKVLIVGVHGPQRVIVLLVG